jgi:ABC-2 type transport system ATP-binding protein
VSGLTAEQVVALLSAKAVPFSEVSAHHATLEQAYLELTRDAAEYRAADAVDRPAASADHGAPRSPGSSAATGQEVAR